MSPTVAYLISALIRGPPPPQEGMLAAEPTPSPVPISEQSCLPTQRLRRGANRLAVRRAETNQILQRAALVVGRGGAGVERGADLVGAVPPLGIAERALMRLAETAVHFAQLLDDDRIRLDDQSAGKCVRGRVGQKSRPRLRHCFSPQPECV